MIHCYWISRRDTYRTEKHSCMRDSYQWWQLTFQCFRDRLCSHICYSWSRNIHVGRHCNSELAQAIWWSNSSWFHIHRGNDCTRNWHCSNRSDWAHSNWICCPWEFGRIEDRVRTSSRFYSYCSEFVLQFINAPCDILVDCTADSWCRLDLSCSICTWRCHDPTSGFCFCRNGPLRHRGKQLFCTRACKFSSITCSPLCRPLRICKIGRDSRSQDSGNSTF